MGFINKLFASLFRKRNQTSKPSGSNMDDYMARWELERQEKIQAAESGLKDWIVMMLKEKGSLIFTWESGGDEAFVTFKDRTDLEEEKFMDLEEYIIDKLNIPDAGEFEMNGSGTLYIESDFLKCKYSSTIKAIVDYDEENDQEVYSDEEMESGEMELFPL